MLRKALAAWILTAAALSAQNVEGVVTNSATGGGISGVVVGLVTAGQTAYTATTDTAGRFRIEAVKDGSYVLFYRAPNFRPAPNGAATTFQVTAGGAPVHLEFAMFPLGKISGRVLDAAGKPVPNASVLLQQPERGNFVPAKADAKGEYHSPESMIPGSWTISATAPSSLPPPEPRDGQQLAWAQTFYPGVTDPSLAAQVPAPPGGDTRDIDIKLAAVPAHRIRGVLLDVHGDPVPKLSISLGMGGMGAPATVHQDTSPDDGKFEFDSVVDNEWRLSATMTKDGVKLWAAQWVQVKGRDVENVELRLTAPFSIQGKIVMEVPEGGPVPADPRARKPPGILLVSGRFFGTTLEPSPGGGAFEGNPDERGDLTLKNLYPGPHQIVTPHLEPPYYLDSIRLGDRDALESDVPLAPGDPPIMVTYKLNGGTVRGTVEACGGGEVMLIPQDAAHRRDGFIYRTNCGPNGQFEIPSVRPGDYYGLAFAKGEITAESLDRSLINQSSRVTVRPNESTDAQLRLAHRF